jgi:hypothetical protein
MKAKEYWASRESGLDGALSYAKGFDDAIEHACKLLMNLSPHKFSPACILNRAIGNAKVDESGKRIDYDSEEKT